MSIVTRFAPSPTGFLHRGHAFSALQAYRFAKMRRGRFLLRIEDIDITRARPEFVDGIIEDLTWLGLTWESPVRIQSQHFTDYGAVLAGLQARGLVYPCFCTRKDIEAEIKAASGAPHGPDGPVYPGTCRGLSRSETDARIKASEPHAWRLDMAAAVSTLSAPLTWQDGHRGLISARPERFGDVVLARKDIPTSYHLAVVHDDALQGVSDIVRGEDLLEHTDIHVLLQNLLGYPTPRYHHHILLMGPDGQRLAKRDKSETLRSIRERGMDGHAIAASL